MPSTKAFRIVSISAALVAGVLLISFMLGTRYGKGAVPMSADLLLKVAGAKAPSDFTVNGKAPFIGIRVAAPAGPSLDMDWFRGESAQPADIASYQLGWLYAAAPETRPNVSSKNLKSDYRMFIAQREATFLPILRDLLRLIWALPTDEFTTGVYGHPERKHFSPDRLNIEVLLSYPEDLKWDRTLGYAVLPPDAVNSPVYMASCDPRPENKVKKDSYYNECLAILKHIKEKFLAPARKLFPEIPETRITTIAPPKLTDKQKVKHLD